MTLNKARIISLSHCRAPGTLRQVARALLAGNERDQSRAAEFAAKALRMERLTLDAPESGRVDV